MVTDEIRAIFQQLDDDNSGYIEVHELDDMLIKMGITDEAERKAKVPLTAAEFYL
jgi:Ca2+-binding EF-hand superfamily protein